MVEPAGVADDARLDGRTHRVAIGRTNGAQGRPGPQGARVLRAVAWGHGWDAVGFVSGRPVSQVTEDYLGWVCQRLAAEGKKALLLIWDNASWHVSKRVRAWIKTHNHAVKAQGGVRIVACYLPVKSPWLNAIEPKWAHGKKAIVEPDRLLSAGEVRDRVCAYYHCEPEPPLVQQTGKKVP